MTNLSRIGSAFALSVALTSCVTSPYQKRGIERELDTQLMLDSFEQNTEQQIALEARSLETFSSAQNDAEPLFRLGIIEVSDQGAINEAQRRRTLDMLDAVLGRDQGALAHGWHHGCSTCDRDLACFRRVLGRLGEDERQSQHPPRPVVGVYIGWRGSSLVGSAGLLTLWNRKVVAERIGSTAMKTILFDLHDRWQNERNSDIPMTMVTVGHSLGGAMVLRAVRGQLTGNIGDIPQRESGAGAQTTAPTRRAVRSIGEPGDTVTKPLRARFGDLVVLMNPAIEAEQYLPFDQDLRGGKTWRLQDGERAYDPDQLPIILTIASTADTANGRLFPVARWISFLTNPFKNGEVIRRRGERLALGRHSPQVTHTLSYKGSIDVKPIDKDVAVGRCGCSKTWQDLTKPTALLSADTLPTAVEEPPATPIYLQGAAPSGSSGTEIAEARARGDLAASGCRQISDGRFDLCLAPERACEKGIQCRGWDPRSPYWVVQVGADVVSEHSDIFNPVVVDFIRGFLLSHQMERAQKGKSEAY